MSDRELYCDTCEGVVWFEVLPGADRPDDRSGSPAGHAGPEWSELVCTGCGAALFVARVAIRAPRPDARRRASRPAQRRAA